MPGCPAQPRPTHGPACILADVGEGAGALHCGPGLRCLAWSRPLGLAGGWELGPCRAHSRLGGGRLAAVHSDGHGLRPPSTPVPMPEPMNLPGLRLARLGYDAQVAVREQRARLRTPIHPRRDARELRMLR